MILSYKNTRLLERISKGDENAFKELFDIYYHKLFNEAYYFLKDKECAEDVVTDVFYIIWCKRHDLPNVNDIDSYLYITTKNQSFHYLNKGLTQIDHDCNLYELEYIAEKGNPEDELLDREYLKLVQEAIDSLPDKCKEIFRLYLDNVKQKDIATILEISIKTVEMQISIAYKRIKKYVTKRYDNM
jgi:RNA polymerase sigma-70 factor (ECF subfamily)